jgi:hypothetical protein
MGLGFIEDRRWNECPQVPPTPDVKEIVELQGWVWPSVRQQFIRIEVDRIVVRWRRVHADMLIA